MPVTGAVGVRADRTPGGLALCTAAAIIPPAKHIDLLPEDQDFRLEIRPRFEKRGKQSENQLEQVGHQATRLRRLLPASMPNRIFGTHRRYRISFLLSAVYPCESTFSTAFPATARLPLQNHL
jgi:hypothetical protein